MIIYWENTSLKYQKKYCKKSLNNEKMSENALVSSENEVKIRKTRRRFKTNKR